MDVRQTELPGVVEIVPKVFGDDRGFFLEVFHSGKFAAHGLEAGFVQDNLSRSQQGVLRGLHYQIQHPQGKLVNCLSGAIFDVAVDLRRSSPTFGKWVGVVLDDQKRNALYIPPGFAHGFYVLSKTADVFYKCTDLYYPEFDRSLLWSDPQVGIEWSLTGDPQLSAKDLQGKPLAEAECFE
ncbi:dTDP-4-dehydrorhamnose 3,5-epimerase [Planctomicrobium sp. SH668]|uniref:dTDP-4-dehydrorhamnose 3,5-epimerase n=1 Tax=Planctomicrobium sp. SH668 TaxID=3448126 RepID=UPI003F5C895A